jgi:putative sigma-54 modulation protein
MEIIVTFRHLEPNDALRDYAREKVSRIEKYVSAIKDVHVVLSIEKRSFIAEVLVFVNRAKIAAREVNEDNMYTAIDLVMDKIERQVKKYKDKLTSHKDAGRQARHNVYAAMAAEEAAAQPSIVRTESIRIEAMGLGDALRQIEQGDDDFYVFKNTDNDKVSVLYRRRDGDFGLIEPDNA